MRNLSSYLDLARVASSQVSQYLLAQREKVSLKLIHKSGTHYGIEEDLTCHHMYEAFFKKHSPEIAVYSEEGKKHLTSEPTWVIDPIEGTSNYRSQNPIFATQMSLLVEREPVLSLIRLPVLDEEFIAMRDKGATLNGKPIKVSQLRDIRMAMISIGKGTREKDRRWWINTVAVVLRQVRSIRLLGSTGIELAYVACGRLDLHLNNGSQLYDYAGGALLVEEAGGKSLNFSGKKWGFVDSSICSGNDQLTMKVLNVLKKGVVFMD